MTVSGPLRCDLAIIGGRVLDPETGLDAVRTVAVTGGRIVGVTVERVEARETIEAAGHMVAPGWIDLHSHAQSVAGGRLQAHDGVTSALDLEGGVTEVGAWYDAARATGRAIHYGTSAGWQAARMVEVGRFTTAQLVDSLALFGDPRWKAATTPLQHDRLLDRIARDLDAGAVGVGLLMGYAPDVDPAEYLAISRLAASAGGSGTATFTHARDLVEVSPQTPVDGAEEIVRAAQETGVRAHYCHVNSTSTRHVDRVHRLVERSSAPVTTEAYPYGAAATAISAAFLAPERLAERGLTPSSIIHSPSGRRVADAAELRHLRATDPGAVAIVHLLDESNPHDLAILDRCLTFPETVVASDAMPLAWPAERADPYAWPPPARTPLHPRTAGTFSRFWRRYVRETGAVTPLDAVQRASLGPARVLAPFVPAMRRKGRIQVGCDADLVVLDPQRVSDQATYDHGSATSIGYAAVLVDGRVVVRDDVADLDALPGRPLRAE